MTFKYPYFMRFTTYLIIALFVYCSPTSAQQLSDEAQRRVSRTLRIMEGSTAIKKVGGIYTFEATFKHEYDNFGQLEAIGHLPYRYMMNLAYSDPHEGLDSRPINKITYEISTDKVVLKIYDRVQLTCETYDNGQEKAPADPFTQFLKCKSGSTETIDGILLFEDKNFIRPKIVTSCSHSKKHMQYIGGTNYGIRNGQIKKGVEINYYAPWKFTHNQVVTYDLNKIAKDNNITKKQLVYYIIEKGLIGIGTNKDGMYNDLSDEEQYYLIFSLWKLFGNPEDLSPNSMAQKVEEPKIASRAELMTKANHYLDAAKIAVQQKQREQAILLLDTAIFHFAKAYEWCENKEQEDETWKLYINAYLRQTYNAYRLMKTSPNYISIFRRNYDYFTNKVKSTSPSDWAMLEDGLGMIALELKDYEEAITHLSVELKVITNVPDLKFVNRVRVLLAKAYIGAEKYDEAKKLIDYILDIQPDNSEAKELKERLST